LALLNGTPNAKPTSTSAPTSAPQTSGGLPKATKITIIYHEGTGEFDVTTFATWSDLQNALEKIYDDWSNNPIGYDKVKIEIEWENGKKLIDRVDVGEKFKPYQTFIGDYLKDNRSAWFETNFEYRPSPNDRDSVSWTDEAQSQSSSTQQPEEQPEQQEQQPQTQMPQNSIILNLVGYTNYILTESEIETIYGVDWRKLEKLDWIDELDYTLGTMINENKAMQLINNGTLSVEIDGLDYTIPVEATTLACYKDYNDLSAQEIDEIIDGLKIYLEIGVGVSEERKNAYELMENLKLFKQHNK
jgi:hypothetical protein